MKPREAADAVRGLVGLVEAYETLHANTAEILATLEVKLARGFIRAADADTTEDLKSLVRKWAEHFRRLPTL